MTLIMVGVHPIPSELQNCAELQTGTCGHLSTGRGFEYWYPTASIFQLRFTIAYWISDSWNGMEWGLVNKIFNNIQYHPMNPILHSWHLLMLGDAEQDGTGFCRVVASKLSLVYDFNIFLHVLTTIVQKNNEPPL